MEVYQSFFSLLINLRKIPKHKIDGTHKPTNRACSLLPVNQETSENISDNKAAAKSRISEIENFLNIGFYAFHAI